MRYIVDAFCDMITGCAVAAINPMGWMDRAALAMQPLLEKDFWYLD